MSQPNSDQQWNLESLSKAYRQGYMAGMTGQAVVTQPFDASVPAAAWEAGWVDGDGQRQLSESKRQLPSAQKRA